MNYFQCGGADDSNSSGGTSIGSVIMSIFQIIAWIAALFLAFKCRGMDPMHLIVACCCPYCYIPYGLYCMVKGGSSGGY